MDDKGITIGQVYSKKELKDKGYFPVCGFGITLSVYAKEDSLERISLKKVDKNGNTPREGEAPFRKAYMSYQVSNKPRTNINFIENDFVYSLE
ncbi:MAG: hypothetical protein GOU98_00150 [Candidatus Altiarchaeota archaeon]|nr:hypothetical protein [Candidatus Altiarchaeota archaeon]